MRVNWKGFVHLEAQQASQPGITVLAVSVPFSLDSSFGPFYQTFLSPSSDAADTALREASNAGRTVEIDVQESREENWERLRLEDLLTMTTVDWLDTDLIILCECLKA